MEVRDGIATQYAAEKFDITLDETDLARMGHEYGFEVAALTSDQAYLLLTLQAHRYVLVQAPKYGREHAVASQGIHDVLEQMAGVLAGIKGSDLQAERKAVGLEALGA